MPHTPYSAGVDLPCSRHRPARCAWRILVLHLTSQQGLPSMSSNVGLNTPRGSGTSGYVQRNQSYLRPRDPIIPTDIHSQKHQPREPDQEILKHDRLREIEVKVFDLQVQLEDDE